MKHILSKSTFMYGCQCPKRLYLHKYRPDLRNEIDEQQEALFTSGTSVGEYARNLFPGGKDASPPDPFSFHISVDATQKMIHEGESIIYEAAFQHEGILCALDILVKSENGWLVYEVKSSASLKAQHLQDAALQYYVLVNCGFEIIDFSIVHLNNQYTRNGNIQVNQLFSIQSVIEDVKNQSAFVEGKIFELKALLKQPAIPEIDIGPHCYSPYECDFTQHCWSHMPKEDSVFDLPGKHAWNLYEQGYKHLLEIPEHIELTGKAYVQLKHYRTGEININREEIRKFIQGLSYPLYFFDFETIMPGIPEFENTRPYQQIPFQYSLHVQHEPDGELEHYEYLGDGVHDPRPDLIKQLIEEIGTDGNIVCYNMTFEKSRIQDLITSFPAYEKELSSIKSRIVDLMIPFAKRWYYHPNFKGSYSIKTVLPILIPDLKYSDLNIKEGGTASMVYSQLKFMEEEIAHAQRTDLLEYCKLDTLAMVRILGFLKSVIGSVN